MRLRHYLLLGLIALAGLAASFWIIPRQQEVALMYLRAKQYESARQTYQAQEASIPLTATNLKPLTDLYLEFGDVDEAVDLMERFVRQHPGNVGALRRLALYYRYAQRPNEYLRTLEQIVRREPAEADLRELSSIYNFTGQYEPQIQALETLTQQYPAQPEDFLDLASLQASQGHMASAVETMRRFQAAHPHAVTADTVELLVSLLLDTGESQRAFDRAVSWLSGHPQPETAARFASLLHYKGEPGLALRLLAPFEKVAGEHPPLLAELTQAEIAVGLSEQAFARLQELYRRGRLPEVVLESFVDLALARQDVALAVEAVRGKEMSLLPDWLLGNLAEAALASGQGDFACQMAASLGELFLEKRPVLVATLALSQGQRAAAQRWADRAAAANLTTEQRVALAGVYSKLGRDQDALALLQQLAASGEAPDAALGDLAELYLKLDRGTDGLLVFEKLRLRDPSPQADAGWAILAARAGHTAEVTRWLRSAKEASAKEAKEAKISNQLLTDLYYVSTDGGDYELALAAAERLHRRRNGRQERLLLANALTAAGRPGDALPHLRTLLPGGPEEQAAYAAALAAALDRGLPVREELRRYWSGKIREAGLSEQQRDEALYALLELKADAPALPVLREYARQRGEPWLSVYLESASRAGRNAELTAFLQQELHRGDLTLAEQEARLHALQDHAGDEPALPFLQRFAEQRGGNWAFAYEEALEKLGRRQELFRYWKSQAERTGLLPHEKRALADRVLAAGRKDLAEQILLSLAREAPPDSPDVQQLLFLWGPRPDKSALEWMEERALSSSGAAKAGWMEHLVNAGAAQRAVAVSGGGFPLAEHHKAVVDVYLTALAAVRDGPSLAATVDWELRRETDTERLRRMARLCLETGRNASAQRAYLKLLSLAPRDGESLRRLGALAFAASDYSLARDYLKRYLDAGGEDYESNYYYAESLLRGGRQGEARIFYERALGRIDRRTEKPFALRALRAQLLQRLGRTEAALAAMEDLLEERPQDASARADYAALLLDAGRHEIAQRVLSKP